MSIWRFLFFFFFYKQTRYYIYVSINLLIFYANYIPRRMNAMCPYYKWWYPWIKPFHVNVYSMNILQRCTFSPFSHCPRWTFPSFFFSCSREFFNNPRSAIFISRFSLSLQSISFFSLCLISEGYYLIIFCHNILSRVSDLLSVCIHLSICLNNTVCIKARKIHCVLWQLDANSYNVEKNSPKRTITR